MSTTNRLSALPLQVCIVMKRDTKKLYAMKYMNKTRIIQEKAMKNVYNERTILELLDHPLMVNLWFAFQVGSWPVCCPMRGVLWSCSLSIQDLVWGDATVPRLYHVEFGFPSSLRWVSGLR